MSNYAAWLLELAGRAVAQLLPVMGIVAGKDTTGACTVGHHTAGPSGAAGVGIDDFALRRSRQYATVLVDADSGAWVDVLPGRGAGVVTYWLRSHPGIEVVCRDGSNTYCQRFADFDPVWSSEN